MNPSFKNTLGICFCRHLTCVCSPCPSCSTDLPLLDCTKPLNKIKLLPHRSFAHYSYHFNCRLPWTKTLTAGTCAIKGLRFGITCSEIDPLNIADHKRTLKNFTKRALSQCNSPAVVTNRSRKHSLSPRICASHRLNVASHFCALEA
jgi:hypothetical protein